MAQRLRHESLTCSICLEILKEPVTLPCGHSYCRECIEAIWSREVSHSCPQCRQSFTPRPVLSKNTVLANLLEELKTSGLIMPTADRCHGNSRDVSCDFCPGKRVKSCLQCLNSFCGIHLQPHRDDAILQQHQLVEPTDKLLDHHCFPHNELKTLFCHTDQQLICHLCVDQHKGHDTVSSAAERAERQKHVDTKKMRLIQTLQDKETKQNQLRQEAGDIKNSAQAAVHRSRQTFREMALLLEQQIQSEEQSQLKQVQDLQDQLQLDITDLKKNISKLDTLSLTTDHSQFILLYPSLSTLTEEPETRTPTRTQTRTLTETLTTPRKDFEDFIRLVSELKSRLQLGVTNSNILKRRLRTRLDFRLGSSINFSEIFSPEPNSGSRADFLKYACEITLNPKTANRLLSLSDGNRRASLGVISASDDPDRFIDCYQVLSVEAMRGRHYWEVELSGKYFIDVAVSYRDIERGRRPDCQSVFGHNDKSWAVCCDTNGYAFRFNRQTSKISGPVSSRIGVYLNYRAGILSFYSIRDETMSLIHRVQTKFTQPLFAGVGFALVGDAAHFLQLK